MYYDVQKSAERIRDLRTGSNLTQSEAADRMGISLSGYRNGAGTEHKKVSAEVTATRLPSNRTVVCVFWRKGYKMAL